MVFDVVYASLIGDDHRGDGCGWEMNQDGVAVVQEDDLLIVVVADGNTSAKKSATAGALLTKTLAEIVKESIREHRVVWRSVWRDFVSAMDHIRRIARLTVEEAARVYFAAAYTVLVVTPRGPEVVCFGDGWGSVNRRKPVGVKWKPNAPPCVSHLLLPKEERPKYRMPGEMGSVDPYPLHLLRLEEGAPFQEAALTTDGGEKLLKSGALHTIDRDRVFRDTTGATLGNAMRKIVREHDLVIEDDTTLALVRRRSP